MFNDQLRCFNLKWGDAPGNHVEVREQRPKPHVGRTLSDDQSGTGVDTRC